MTTKTVDVSLCIFFLLYWGSLLKAFRLRIVETKAEVPVSCFAPNCLEDRDVKTIVNERSPEILKDTQTSTRVEGSNDLLENAINEAELRPSCADVIHTFSTTTPHKDLMSLHWLNAIKSLWYTSTKPLYGGSDKDAVAALNSFAFALQHSRTLDFGTLNQLVTCSLDEHGRTITMKLVEKGFIQALQSTVLWTVLIPADYADLIYTVDKKGNNLLHLAVLSRSSDVVHHIVSILDEHLNMDALKPYFDNRNKEGLRAIDLARHPGVSVDISTVLLDYYRAHYYDGGSITKRNVTISAPAPPKLESARG